MWPTHVYRTPSEPLPNWLFHLMFWLIMPPAIGGLIVNVEQKRWLEGAPK
jgi:hypothetical protein